MPRKVFKTINPSTGDVLETYDEMSPAAVDAAMEDCRKAQRAWRGRTVAQRAELLVKLAGHLRAHRDAYAHRLALEMGKVLREGLAEIEKCARACDYYAEHGEAFLRAEPVGTEAKASYVDYRPLGIILAIMPWNFPFWQVFRFGLPALLAGNGILLKHAPSVFGCAGELEKLVLEAGLPEGLVRSLIIDTPQVGPVIEDGRVSAVTVTGSVRTGRAVAQTAGRALKKCVLELGGSDPFIVLEDADIDQAAEAAVASRFQNCGQSCIAAKRFIVVDSVYAAFEDGLLSRVNALRMGDPCAADVDLGPLARLDLRAHLHGQVERAIRGGAAVLLGGVVPSGPGAFYCPTVLRAVPAAVAAGDEELFGPVVVLIRVRDETEAIRVANDTAFGLSGSVWTRDLRRGERIAGAVESGSFFVNHIPFSDPRLPIGGIKQSGYGRELSRFGVREFVNIRTVWVDHN